MNVAELISKSFYLSGIVARGLQTVTGDQTADGLDILNDILAEKSITTNLIPYYTHTIVNTVAGQAAYEINNLLEVSEITFEINTVLYPMTRMTQYQYWGQTRITNLESLPISYYPEQQLGKTILYLYFVPDQVYPLRITGKYSLSEVILTDEISEMLDLFYLSYLKHYLAKRLCDFYGVQLNESAIAVLESLDSQLDRMVGIDLSLRTQSMFNRSQFSYAQANIGHGWEP